VLRAQELHLTLLWIPMVMIVMSVVYALASYPAGLLAARVGRDRMLLASLAALCAAELVLGLASGHAALWTGIALWGLHMGLSQGGLTATVAAHAPAELRATAFGVFHFVTGAFQLVGGVFAGWLWSRHGSAIAFGAGALWALLTALVLAVGRGRPGPA
jgi:MFS family permease